VPVQNLYGIKFSISADPLIFEANNASIKISPSFFGTGGVNLIGMKIYNSSSGLIDIGLTRINHTNVSGYGNFATLSIPVKNILSQKYLKVSLAISNNNQISYDGKNVPLYFSSDSIVVQQSKSGVNGSLSKLKDISLYPNPFQSSTTLHYSLIQKSNIQITLLDITGKSIALISSGFQPIGQYSLDIDAQKYNLKPGIYLLEIRTDDGFSSRQIVKF
jgi:hypothetical protein